MGDRPVRGTTEPKGSVVVRNSVCEYIGKKVNNNGLVIGVCLRIG